MMLEDRVAVVTGGGRGIGREHCLELARHGARVLVNDPGVGVHGEQAEERPADAVVDEITAAGGVAIADHSSVTDWQSCRAMVQRAVDELGALDIVVNNAGIVRDRIMTSMTEEDFDVVVAVHLKGHFNLCKHASVVFRQQRSGVFVNTSSEAGLGNRGQVNYASAKEGIIGLTRTLARDLGGYGVRANAIRPRAATRMVISDEMKAAAQRSGGASGMSREALEAFERTNRPEAVGPFVAWLCTDAAANINGRDFVASGSLIALYSLPEVVAEVDNPDAHMWTLEELDRIMPAQVTAGLVNAFPAKAPA